MLKGTKHTNETRKKLSLAKIGNTNLLGFKFSEYSKNKMSKSHMGMKNHFGFEHTKETKLKMSILKRGKHISSKTEFKKGFKHTEEWKRKNSIRMKGERNPNWIKDREIVRQNSHKGDVDYQEWRKQVYARDNWKCRIADNNCKGKIEAHHILRFSEYPELRYVVNNGITLCHGHHPRRKEDEKRLSPYFQTLVLNNE